MRIKLISDFHTEFWNYNKFARLLEMYLPSTPEDKDTVLCCAGDMGTYQSYRSSYKPLLRLLGERFKYVVMVPGNHSWYNSIGLWGTDFWADKKLPKNVFYLDNDTIVLDDVVFIGSCLWTSFDNSNPIALHAAASGMNDYRRIKTGYRTTTGTYIESRTERLRPEATVDKFNDSWAYINSALGVCRKRKRVVITHHAPSYLSVSERFKGDLLTAAFASELSDIIEAQEPELWLHGHMHDNKDYTLFNTRVLCNPLGYHAVEINKDFKPDLIVEI